MINLFMASKNPKRSSKKQNLSRNQKSTRANMNSNHQMEQFDSIIVYFGGLNRYQRHVSLYIARI
jgi:hypothetical protein